MIDKVQKQYLLFDLDGTILDSAKGIKKSFQYSIKKMEKKEIPFSDFTYFAGPPLQWSFQKMGFTKNEILQAISFYKEYYSKKGMYECKVYDGIEDALYYLKGMGKKIILATSKGEKTAIDSIKYYKLENLFDYIAGTDYSEGRDTKAKVIQHIINHFNIRKETVLMIGDTHFDIEGAKEAGVSCLGVLYGYGTKQELKQAGADDILNSVSEFQSYFKEGFYGKSGYI